MSAVPDGPRPTGSRDRDRTTFPDGSTGDPVADLILAGRAATVGEAAELYLNEHLEDVAGIVQSDLGEDEFAGHPLIMLLLARGSRPWEDSVR